MAFIISVDVCVRFLQDSILPPLTSKVLKYVVESRCRVIKDLMSVRRSFKPAQISMLFASGEALYSSAGGGVVSVKAGAELKGRLTLACSDATSEVMEELQVLSGTFNSPYGMFQLDLLSIELRKLSALSMGLSKFFKVEFTTPTILTAKHMVPPPLKDRSRSLPERHRLLPQPSFIFSYLLKLWNSIAGPEERIPGPGAGDWEAYKLGRLADVTLVEVDYRLKPVTVVIGRDSRGRLRMARGFTGWVIYECLSRKLLSIYDRLLALATYLGVGRSRGIGLGMIKVTNLKLRDSESSQKKP